MLRNKLGQLVILSLSLVCAVTLVRPASAVVPSVLDAVVWSNGSKTILNITVFHSPQSSIHHLDRIEVYLNGDNRVFPVDYRPETTFVVSCDLGVVETQKNATIRAHCNIDLYSQPYGPILVPEFSFILASFLLVTAMSLALIVYRRR